MRIAQISTCYHRTPPAGVGGIEWLVSYLTEELVAMGHEVTLFATGDSVTRAGLWSLYETPTGAYDWADEIEHAAGACEYIAEREFDIVHNHLFSLGLAPLYLCGAPSITTMHIGPHQVWSTVHKAVSKRLQFVSISRKQKERELKLNWIGTVHNGLNVDDFPYDEKKEDYLLFMGRINREKGPHLAIQAARKAGRRLKLAGPIDLPITYFEEQIAPMIDGTSVEYVGEVDFDQKVDLYRRATALVAPTTAEESFGMVFVEAMSCGTPVITFAIGAAPEIILHGETGYLVTDMAEFVDAIRKLDRISAQACREHVERTFSSRVMAQRYMEIYEKVLVEHKTGMAQELKRPTHV
jgi:glycosyltransferase involved in cell wall biosynthesis